MKEYTLMNKEKAVRLVQGFGVILHRFKCPI